MKILISILEWSSIIAFLAASLFWYRASVAVVLCKDDELLDPQDEKYLREDISMTATAKGTREEDGIEESILSTSIKQAHLNSVAARYAVIGSILQAVAKFLTIITVCP